MLWNLSSGKPFFFAPNYCSKLVLPFSSYPINSCKQDCASLKIRSCITETSTVIKNTPKENAPNTGQADSTYSNKVISKRGQNLYEWFQVCPLFGGSTTNLYTSLPVIS